MFENRLMTVFNFSLIKEAVPVHVYSMIICSSIDLRGCTRMERLCNSKLHQKWLSNPDDNWLGSLIRFCGRFVYKSPPVYLSIQYKEYLPQKQSSPRTHTHVLSNLHFVYEFQLEIYGFNLGWESANWQYLGTRETYWAVYTQHPYLWLIVSLYIRFRFRGVFCLFSQHIRQEIYVLYCSLRLAS